MHFADHNLNLPSFPFWKVFPESKDRQIVMLTTHIVQSSDVSLGSQHFVVILCLSTPRHSLSNWVAHQHSGSPPPVGKFIPYNCNALSLGRIHNANSVADYDNSPSALQ
jgi:hypothetical protein